MMKTLVFFPSVIFGKKIQPKVHVNLHNSIYRVNRLSNLLDHFSVDIELLIHFSIIIVISLSRVHFAAIRHPYPRPISMQPSPVVTHE